MPKVWKAELELIDAWMRRRSPETWLRDPSDRSVLARFLIERHGFSTEIDDAVSRLQPVEVERPDVEVHPHAVDRYRERTGCKRTSRWIAARLLQDLARSEEVQLKPKYRATQLMNHAYAEATYHRAPSGMILVLERGNLIRTVHYGEAKKWQRA